MRCTWDKKLLVKLYSDPTIRDELSGLLLSYVEFLDVMVNYKRTVKNAIKNDGDYIKANFFIEDLISDFLTKSSIVAESQKDYIHRFNKEDILLLASSFYNNLEDDFRNIFMELFSQRFDHLRFSGPMNSRFFTGSTFHSNHADETFIACQYNKTFVNILSLIHEYAHGISFQINGFKPTDEEYNAFCEIESIFMELVALDFFEKHHPEFINDITLCRKKLYNSLIEDATIVNYKIDFKYIIEDKQININDQSTLSLIRLLINETGLSLKDILYVLQLPASTLCKYPIGALIAFELYDIYQRDTKEAFNMYRKIIFSNIRSNAQFYEKIKEMGITPSSHLETFERKLTKY